MSLFSFFKNRINGNKDEDEQYDNMYEYCPNCDANLTLQKGYSSDMPYWVCKGCGQMLINPDIPDDSAWICDECGAMLNIQDGFSESCGIWKCTECGHENRIDASEIYGSEEDYQAELRNPYRGMSDAYVVELMSYEEIEQLGGREDITLVKGPEDDHLYVKKILTTYDASVYRYLLEHPVAHMPRLQGVYEGDKHLVIIEEYISGISLSELIDHGELGEAGAVSIVKDLCIILSKLHGLEQPIIHRDIKPSNVIISDAGETYLLDINAAKWYKPEESEDTRLLGTMYYAAPEQFGYGYSASSEKTDIYAVGVLLNVMITGRIPKEEKAQGPVWDIIEKCTRLDPEERYTARELIEALSEKNDSKEVDGNEREIPDEKFSLKDLFDGKDVKCLVCKKGILKPYNPNVPLRDNHCFKCNACGELLNIDPCITIE